MIVPRKKVSIQPKSYQNKITFLSQNPNSINDMTQQFETIFKDLAENINLEDLENMEGAITF